MFTIYIHMLITPVTTYTWWIKKLIRLISVEYSICNPQRKVNSHIFVTWLPLARYLKKEFRKFTNIILWLYHWVFVFFFFSCSGPYLTKISILKKFSNCLSQSLIIIHIHHLCTIKIQTCLGVIWEFHKMGMEIF